MGGHDCTPEESERIHQGEQEYADPAWETCPSCRGDGQDQYGYRCTECRGTGEVHVDKNPEWEAGV